LNECDDGLVRAQIQLHDVHDGARIGHELARERFRVSFIARTDHYRRSYRRERSHRFGAQTSGTSGHDDGFPHIRRRQVVDDVAPG